MTRQRGLLELYRDDPERADALVFGRRAGPGRRGFLRGAGLAAFGAAVGGAVPFSARMPAGLVPAAVAQGAAPKLLRMDGKAELVILGERPLVAETPEHLLDDDTTPSAKFFIRNNGQTPEAASLDPRAWKIKVDGEVNAPLDLSPGELESRFPLVTFRLQLECGGNGRSAFIPEARGNQWGNGAIGVAEWTGVRLRDVLQAAGLKPSAVFTGHYGADPNLANEPGRPSISRGVPIAKAMEEHSLIALRMNGQPIPAIHGAPARLVIPGWPGSVSAKWLTRIWVRDKVHDGPGMGGTSYRVPIVPIVPGSASPDANFRILESMPVRSIVTAPANGAELAAGQRRIALRGAAWAGEKSVRAVETSIDFGASWAPAQLAAPRNRYDWQRWTASVELPSAGYFEIWSRATDSDGRMQTHAAANWNPQGYGANVLHRVAVLAKS
jgi:DMSO/TMAO reductase YedYZ molybdopterin-dependent catalytic subunit